MAARAEYLVLYCYRSVDVDGGLSDWFHQPAAARPRGFGSFLRRDPKTELVGLGAILSHYAADGWELAHTVPGSYQGIFTPSDERTPTNLEVVSAEFVLRRDTADSAAPS